MSDKDQFDVEASREEERYRNIANASYGGNIYGRLRGQGWERTLSPEVIDAIRRVWGREAELAFRGGSNSPVAYQPDTNPTQGQFLEALLHYRQQPQDMQTHEQTSALSRAIVEGSKNKR